MNLEDNAQVHELTERAARIAGRNVPANYEPGDKLYGPAECRAEDCETEMPHLRRSMGCRLCAPCQEEKDRLDARLGRR